VTGERTSGQLPGLTASLTLAALTAFAANSILCRLALASGAIDPWSFTAVRLGTGALTLWLLVSGGPGPRPAGEGRGRKEIRKATDNAAALVRRADLLQSRGDWVRAGFLVLYALPFSLAYIELGAGTGALLLFGAVQLTMIGLGIVGGERPHVVEWVGLFGAAGGMVYFLLPGATAPDPLGAILMIAAGVGWGLYSIAGKRLSGDRRSDPLTTTAEAFRRGAVVVAVVLIPVASTLSLSGRGLLLATISGALTSGLGYVLWYRALRGLSATLASLVQLAVPVLAALGGVVVLAEQLTGRLLLSGFVILGSIAFGVWGRTEKVGEAS
jgi:drug/metabolite transporter (DMT)-like permease